MNFQVCRAYAFRPAIRIVLAAGLLFLFSTAQAALVLEFNVTRNVYDTKLENIGGKKKSIPKNTSEQYKQTLVLDGRRYSVTKGDITEIYDFDSKTIKIFNISNNTYFSRSLYSVIGYRRAEFANRQFLNKVLSSAGADSSIMGRLATEHLFSIQAGKKPLALKADKSGNWVRYGREKAPLFRYQAGKKVSKMDMRIFIQFIRYQLGGHPEILKALQRKKIIPKRFEFSRYNLRREVFDYSLVSRKQERVTFPDIAHYKNIAGQQKLHEIERLIFSNRMKLNNSSEITNNFIKIAENYYSRGKYLDSMLAYLEYTLMSGNDMPPSFDGRKKKIAGNQQVKDLLKFINPRSKQQAEKAVKVLAALRSHTSGHKHILGIFEGNIRGNLKQNEKGAKLLMAALRKNGFIAGVYKDLGDYYYNSYEAGLAWLCWDFARQISPNHRLLRHITDLEMRLADKYPSFFL